MDKAAKPLKIFISYGHEIDVKDDNGIPLYPEPNNESIVLKIKEYLISRGHKVWIDKEQIQPGDDDWRRKIYDGVKWANIALICLSRKAMKPNGVCRDEIAIAVGVRGGYPFSITLEELKISEYPAYLLNPQLFTEFENWSSHCTSAKNIDEVWLDEKLEKFAIELEKKDFQQYGVEMEELKRLLKPWNMDSRLRNLDRDIQRIYNETTQDWESKTVHKFCGRESLFKMFEEKILQGGHAVRLDSERVLWLKKGPGFGKSRFAAELRYRYCCPITASYFIEYGEKESLEPQTFIKSIAFQLAQTHSSYRNALLRYLKENQDGINLQTGDPQTLFKSLITDLMTDEIDGDRGTQWILVDALDEATKNERNEIAELISHNLKKLRRWICFFITSRDNDDAVNRNFEQFNPIDFSDEENVSDVLKYIQSEFEEMGLTVSEKGVSKERLINLIHEKSEGTFLYPEMVFRDLKKNVITLDDIPKLPSGVIEYIQDQFKRFFGANIPKYKQEIRPMLGFILTSNEPIPRAVLKYCLGIKRDSELDDRLEQLGTFFDQSGTTDEDVIKPFHKSVRDYCFDSSKSFYVYPDEANEDFANRGLELYKTGALQWTTRTDEEPNIAQRYFLTWLPSHLMNASMKEEAASILSDFAFLMKRLRFGNVERVLQDYILFRGALDRFSQASDAYFDVVCSNVHYLRRNSEDNPAYKIMLQIATEVADECPVTQAAERWLNPETGDSPCDWFWLNKANRPKEYQPNPCKLVIENAGNRAKLLSNGDALSWGKDDNIRIFDLQTGVCKAVLEAYIDDEGDAIELQSGDILSWRCCAIRLCSPDGTCKADLHVDNIGYSSDDIVSRFCAGFLVRRIPIFHTDEIKGVKELRSGNILTWSADKTLRLWSPDMTFIAILEGHTSSVEDVVELRSGDILSWSEDKTIRIWSPDGECKAILEGHTGWVIDALELRSGDILSWSMNRALRLWSPQGECKAVLEGHTDYVNGAKELRSGDILSWSDDNTLRLWSNDGKCKAILKGHAYAIGGVKELRSGDILSWCVSYKCEDYAMRLWSDDGKCKAVLEGHAYAIEDVIELRSGDILSWCVNNYKDEHKDLTLRLWSPDGTCKAVLEGHKEDIKGAIELRSGDILSWSEDETLRIWSPNGTCKAVLEGHTSSVEGAIELRSGDILSWSYDNTLRLWYPDKTYKKVLEGHTARVNNATKLSSGNILSLGFDDTLCLWSPMGVCKTVLKGYHLMISGYRELRSGDILYRSGDKTLRIFSPDGTCKTVLEGHTDNVWDAIELSSGDILSWSWDKTLRIWSPDGICKAILEGHSDKVWVAKELRSGDILSWSKDKTLRLWSSEGDCKAILEGHTDRIEDAIELSSGDILSWSKDKTLRLWSDDGTCKAVLEGHKKDIKGVIELHSGDILSWSYDEALRLWSPDGTCKAVLEGHKKDIKGVIELRSGDILSWDYNTLRFWSADGACKAVLERYSVSFNGALELGSGDILSWGSDSYSDDDLTKLFGVFLLWSPDGTCKEEIESDNPQFDSYYALLHKDRVYEQYYVKITNWGIELQYDFCPIAGWNSPSCNFRFVGEGRLCVRYGRFVKFLQLNYGNHMSVSFEQAHQFLAGEIDESKLVTFVPESKESEVPKTE
ncbi:MAG: TIR domain-containing protein [Thermoguttaceae bacterium]|nr:TIR domain-containing protein [Thermoguttaceae bacterium]